MSCGTITLGSSVDCDEIILGGTKDTVTVINYDDIDFVNSVKTNGKITTITLFAGKTAFQFTGAPNHVKKSLELLDIDGYKQFRHIAGWTIFERTQEQKGNIENLARGLYVVIVQNKGNDGDSIEVLGWDVGMKANVQVIQDAFANGGNYVLSFGTMENEFERNFPATLGTSYSDGLSIIEGLLEEGILFGSEEVLFGSELITFND